MTKEEAFEKVEAELINSSHKENWIIQFNWIKSKFLLMEIENDEMKKLLKTD